MTAARGGTVFASAAMTSSPCAHGLDSVVMKERKKTGIKLGGGHWRNMEGMLKRVDTIKIYVYMYGTLK